MNTNLPDVIKAFIQSQHVFTLATSIDNKPHCAICYYAYSEKLNGLVFKSSGQSQHIKAGIQNKEIAASILPIKVEINKVRGAQIEGNFMEPGDEQMKEAKKNYYKKFPFALVIPGDIWLIELIKIKFTDNRLGFAKKINWEKQLASKITSISIP